MLRLVPTQSCMLCVGSSYFGIAGWYSAQAAKQGLIVRIIAYIYVQVYDNVDFHCEYSILLKLTFNRTVFWTMIFVHVSALVRL